MRLNLKARLGQAKNDMRMWSGQLDRKWEQLEQIARAMSIGRDVLIAIKYQEVEERDGDTAGRTTLLGLKEYEDGWCICLGHGPDELPYWDPAWMWVPRRAWTRAMSVEAAGHIESFIEVLTGAAEVIAGEVEEAAALVTQAIHRLG